MLSNCALKFQSLCRRLHTIRLELNNNGDSLRLSSLTRFCLVPKSGADNKEGVVKSSKTTALGVNAKYVVTQQIRKYAPTTSSTNAESACWNCKQGGRKNHMICTSCGYLQDVNAEIQELTRRFRQLQTLVHPDKFSNKVTREQNNSADWSALINKAYKTLSAPVERGQYLLKLQGEHMPQDNSALNTEFLMEMMELNEKVDETNSRESLQQINNDIAQQLKEGVQVLSEKFDSKALNEAKFLLVKMKYLISVQNSIKNKLQKMEDS
ncbi:iron-sulfur cluster co-chaperone protein HscB, mitochondrial isoform X2 [Ceratitis capitata]|uniref:iron-sulfur cluster co-chaperone protein HscB, mitochondrial isoform X2 n=1 Tax=Ceratitis capitata TaxID=7213 RepID=UPI000A118026|nr:iron-sulfur cluster co-chaperone protein HscB, mitochondrial isoform X2 [Ceratitis capitata]